MNSWRLISYLIGTVFCGFYIMTTTDEPLQQSMLSAFLVLIFLALGEMLQGKKD